MELRGLDYLRQKLAHHKTRVDLRYAQYDMKHIDRYVGVTVPPVLRQQYRSVFGWCTKAVDAIADRLSFRGFDNDVFDFTEIFNLNNPDTFFDSAILSSLIASCCFVYISTGSEEVPRLQVIDGGNATGIIDPITGLLREGYAVLARDDYGRPKEEAYFTPDATYIYKDNKPVAQHTHSVGWPLLVPIIHRPDAVREFGRSRITRAAMYYQQYAKRTMERADLTAEFYSFPQKYVLGLSPEAERLDSWRATISSMLQFDKDSDGDKPSVGQFNQPSMSPFTEQLRTAAAAFAGETGLTLDDLGFVTDNPSSAEAIKASHENLRIAARKAQKNFGSGFINVGYLASCLRDDYAYKRNQFYTVVPKWEPVFEPDAATLSSIGDGAIKINQAVPDYFTAKTLRDLTGIKGGNDGR